MIKYLLEYSNLFCSLFGEYMNWNLIKYKLVVIFCLLLIGFSNSSAEDWERIMKLNGYWRFSIGDDSNWAKPNYNDADWEEIRVPSTWENEGFYGYNGYAWYRKSFMLEVDKNNSSYYLQLGFIDDVDEVYLNGRLIGFSGSFPPNYETAYNAHRRYPIPQDLLNRYGKNVIAVRVYDSQMGGGIVSGDIGLYVRTNYLEPEYTLEGKWKFRTGDNMEWKEKNYDDSDWNEIMTPNNWESQGYKDYDGFAWYRKTIELPSNFKKDKYILMLGKIDDVDEAYINGQLVGKTGKMYDEPSRNSYKKTFDMEYSEFRGYYISSNVLRPGKNVVAVRVFDGYNYGGIYEGPIGFITQKKYADYWKKAKRKNIWEIFFNN